MDEVIELHYADGSVAYTEPLTAAQMDEIEEFLIARGISFNIKA